jgi:hypothetical protein
LRIKTSCLNIVLILFSFTSVAQTNELIGKITLTSGSSYTYKLVFSDSAGVIRGYSVSDLKGPYETKAAIEGTMDEKSFSFRETKVLYAKTKSKDYCLLNAKCKVTKQAGMQLFKGKAVGYLNGEKNKQCGKGTALFSSMKDIVSMTSKLMAKVDTSKLNEEQKRTVDSLKRSIQNTSYINIDAKKDATVKWNSDSVRIEIYDDGEIDNDRISVLMDDDYIIKDLTVTAKREYRTIPVTPGNHKLRFHAENEGNSPPNTVKAVLYDGDTKHYISTNLSYNQEAILLINK